MLLIVPETVVTEFVALYVLAAVLFKFKVPAIVAVFVFGAAFEILEKETA